MNCPDCTSERIRTLHTVPMDAETVRTRSCLQCGCRFTTKEALARITRHGQAKLPLPAAVPKALALPVALPAPLPAAVVSPSDLRSGSSSPSDPDPSQASSLLDRGSDGRSTPAARGALFDWALAEFRGAWKAVYGVDYAVTGKDRSQLGRLLGGLSKDGVSPRELPALFRSYLADGARFVAQEQRHALWFFCTEGGVNKYRTNGHAKPAGRVEATKTGGYGKPGKQVL
jgi:hypothetical protein